MRLSGSAPTCTARAPSRATATTWVLTLDTPLARLEYQLELEHADGTTETVLDPGNPNRAPGVFGEKSVALTPDTSRPRGWRPTRSRASSTSSRSAPAGSARRCKCGCGTAAARRCSSPTTARSTNELASLTRYSGAMIASGALPPHRVALLAPADRDEWYSASGRYARALVTDVMRALHPVDAVGMGASLGALAMLHAHVRRPFAGLFLQSGSFFVLRHDAHEYRFSRFQRVIRVVRDLKRDAGVPERVTMTCGVLEENLANNREMARALAGAGVRRRAGRGPRHAQLHRLARRAAPASDPPAAARCGHERPRATACAGDRVRRQRGHPRPLRPARARVPVRGRQRLGFREQRHARRVGTSSRAAARRSTASTRSTPASAGATSRGSSTRSRPSSITTSAAPRTSS